MMPMLVIFVLAALIVGVILRSVLHAALLVGLIAGLYVLCCYAFDASPRALLSQGVHQAKHEYRTRVQPHERKIREWL